PVELGPVPRVQRSELSVEIVRIEQSRFELTDRREERVGESTESGRPSETVEGMTRERPADDQRPLRVGCHRARVAAAAGDPLEQVVERADRAAQQSRLELEQIALDPLDVRP